jgi:hypothetical protein
MVAVVSDSNPFKYAESNQTVNSTGKVSISGSVSLKFSSPVTGAVTVANLSIPILITIPHLPMLDNETVECRYWDPILLEQRTDGCELVASFSNYSVCACEHLTDFSMGFFSKFKALEVTLPRVYHTIRQIYAPPRHTVPSYITFFTINNRAFSSQDIGDTKIEELLPSIEPLTAEVTALLLHEPTKPIITFELIKQDWENLTWDNVIKCEESLGAILVFALFYLGFLPCACAMDRCSLFFSSDNGRISNALVSNTHAHAYIHTDTHAHIHTHMHINTNKAAAHAVQARLYPRGRRDIRHGGAGQHDDDLRRPP